MSVREARELIEKEFTSDDGLDVVFRMSADVESERIKEFISALKCLGGHYEDKETIEKRLIYQLFSMHQTLQASIRHWKVSRPKGLGEDNCFEIFKGIQSVFSN